MGVQVRRKKGERAAIELRWRAIRTSYPWNAPLSPEDDAFIRTALQNHPDVDEKIGIGIDHFVVDDDGQRSCCIWAVRPDKTRTPISKKACLDKPSPLNEFSRACRAAIAVDAIQAKNDAFGIKHVAPGMHEWDLTLDPLPTIICPATGCEITYDQAHAHHDDPWPFKKIVEAFLESRPDINRDDLCSYIQRVPGMDTKIQLKDQVLAADFYLFHKERASLVVVSGEANRSNGLKKVENQPGEPAT
jgi:Protein of unknown function (DUF3223)